MAILLLALLQRLLVPLHQKRLITLSFIALAVFFTLRLLLRHGRADVCPAYDLGHHRQGAKTIHIGLLDQLGALQVQKQLALNIHRELPG